MIRNKKILILALLLGLTLALIVPNISNAATELTYSDTAQGIEWAYEVDDSGNIVNLRCKTTSITGAVTIPSKIDGKTVISLANDSYDKGAFEDCTGLTAVTIPNTITTIGDSAFDGCTGLSTVVIPDSVTKIDNIAFNGCNGLTSVTLSKNLTTLGEGAFRGCTGLKTIVIPDSVSKIERNAFNGCNGLTSVTFSKKLTSIGSFAFSNCTGLKTVTIPNTVTTIGEGAFDGCSGIRELTLSNNLSKISDETFEDCTGLTSVILPDSVTTIEGSGGFKYSYGAFGGCTNLKKILIPDNVASIGEGAFRGCKNLTIYGNDGMASKEFAEQYDFNFDYIANWDKVTAGADITAPTVQNMQVTYKSVMNYGKDQMYMVPAGAKIVINVNFSEAIQGTTVPTLTIKFGDGQNIKVTEGTVSGSTITYIYTIKSTDKGVLTTVDFSGGNIKDTAGNAAKLSCPKLDVQYSTVEVVYANGTATNPSTNNTTGTTNNNTNTNNSTNTNNNTSTNKKPTSSTTTGANKTDTTTAPSKIPQTGESVMIIAVIVAVIGVGTYACVRYNRYKGI